MGADVGVGVAVGVGVGDVVGVGVGVAVGVGVGVGVGASVGACVTITSTGLPVAPVAVTRMVADRNEVLVLAAKMQLIVPVLEPMPVNECDSSIP